MSEKIPITQEHIDTGRVGDAFNCAIAVGLKGEFAYEISVTRMIVIGNDAYQATPEVVRWFGDFDMGRPVKPITIELVSEPFGMGTYERKGRQPIPICGIARVVPSSRHRHNPQGVSTTSGKIQITQEDIDRGIRKSASNCAITVGLKKEFACEISGTNMIVIGNGAYRATPEVVRWFGDFDMGRPVKPITIELVSEPFGMGTYERKGRQPIPICGIARVAPSSRLRRNPQGKYRSPGRASTPAKGGTLSTVQPRKRLIKNFIQRSNSEI